MKTIELVRTGRERSCSERGKVLILHSKKCPLLIFTPLQKPNNYELPYLNNLMWFIWISLVLHRDCTNYTAVEKNVTNKKWRLLLALCVSDISMVVLPIQVQHFPISLPGYIIDITCGWHDNQFYKYSIYKNWMTSLMSEFYYILA